MKNIIWKILPIMLACMLFTMNVCAAENSVINAKTSLNAIYAFIDGAADKDCTVELDGGQCDILSCDRQGDIMTETIVIVDTSGDAAGWERMKTLELLSALIDNKQEDEYFRIVAAGSDLKVVCTYTADRYKLVKSLDDLIYNDTETKLYYTAEQELYNLTDGYLGRMIIISDGGDRSPEGSFEALTQRLDEETCLVYTVGIADSGEKLPEHFFDLAKQTGAKTLVMEEDSDITQLCGSLNEWRDFYRITAALPRNSADGSEKDVHITANGAQYTVKLQMPYIEPELTTSAETLPIFTEAEVTVHEEKTPIYVYVFTVLAAASAAAMILSAVLLLIRKKRRSRETPIKSLMHYARTVSARTTSGESADKKFSYAIEAKKLLQDVNTADVRDRALASPHMMFPRHPEYMAEAGEDYNNILEIKKTVTLTLTDEKSPDSVYTAAIKQEITVGRGADCNIIIPDRRVPMKQCRIYRSGDKLCMENISKSAVYVNGVEATAAELNSGDRIKIGKNTYTINVN
ncbi:MAG: FHA domain-containing protein [Oscillospiraceae bacterium]